jgi:hypothetical protein
LFHVDHSSSLFKGIIWVTFRGIKSNSFILEELSGELVAVYDSENSSIDVDVASIVEVSPCVMGSCIFWPSDFVAFQKHSLRDATVFNSLLYNVQGVVL